MELGVIIKKYLEQLKNVDARLLYWGGAYLALLVFSCTLVYLLRVFYGFGRISAYSMIFISVGFFSLVFYSVFLFADKFRGDFCAKAAAFIMIAAFSFALLNPPLQVPDETIHFWRSYSIAQGNIDFDPNRAYPNDVALLTQNFEKFYNHYYKPTENKTMSERFIDYFNQLRDKKQANEQITEPLVLMIIPYIIPAFAIFLTKLFSLPALISLFAARLANALFYAFICYLALKNCTRYRLVLLSFMLLPISLFCAGSLSYDSSLLCLTFLLVSYGFTEELNNTDLVVICTIAAYLSYIKLLSLLLLLFVFFSSAIWNVKLKKPVFLGIVAVSSLFLNQAMSVYVYFFSKFSIQPRMPDVDPSGQLAFILSNISRYIFVMLGTLLENGFYLLELGNFGWTDLYISIIGLFSVIMLLVVALQNGEPVQNKRAFIAVSLLFALVYTAAVLTGLYASWTPVGMVRVIGVQARYMLPVFLGISFAIAAIYGDNVRHKSVANYSNIILYSCFIFSVFSSTLIFISYHITAL